MTAFPKILALATAVPPHQLEQQQAKEFAATVFAPMLGEKSRDRLLAVFDNSEVKTRHLAVPLQWLATPRTFIEANTQYIQSATELGVEVVKRLLEQAELLPSDIDHLVFVSTT